MPFITQGKANLKYILIIVILAAIVGGGILGYLYFYSETLPINEWWPPKQQILRCEKDTDCVLADTTISPCGSCDLSNPDVQCVSPEKAEELKKERKEKYGYVMCEPCPTPRVIFRCECEENSCRKTAYCLKDEDCGWKQYKCIENKCTYSIKEETVNLTDELINCATYRNEDESKYEDLTDWETYKNEEYGYELRYPTEYSLKILEWKDTPCFRHPSYPGLGTPEDPGCTFVITGNFLEGKKFEDWFKEHFELGFIKEIGGESKCIKTGEKNWFFIWNPEGPGSGNIYYFITDRNIIITIESGNIDLQEEQTFNQILSTFKFLD